MTLSFRVLSSATLLAIAASCKQLILNFDDIAISNDHGCVNSTLDATIVYHGVAVSNSFGAAQVLNATKTPTCNSAINKEMSLALFGRATSPSNVLFISADLEAQIISDVTVSLINEASFDIWPVFTEAELNSNNVTVTVRTLLSDFNTVDIREEFEFHTATDGWGPYHVSTSSNGVNYLFLEASVSIPTGVVQIRVPSFFVDTLVLESTE